MNLRSKDLNSVNFQYLSDNQFLTQRMKFNFLFLFILLFNTTFGQNVGPRFGAEITSYSLVFYPQQFDNISTPTGYEGRLFETEVYDIKHSKINFSLGQSLGFHANWVNREKWRLTHRFSLGIGKYSGTTELTLKSHSDSLKTNLPYTTTEVSVGYQSTALFEGNEYFLSTDLMLFRKFDSNWELGIGCGFQQILRPGGDYKSSTGYFPTDYTRSSIATDCFSPTIHVQAEKNWDLLSVFVSYSQAVYITKSKTYFGETTGKPTPEPSSLNEVSRLPGRLMLGCRINWGI